jgi:hydroxymethylglutaryl-CoA reductase (NADPH)
MKLHEYEKHMPHIEAMIKRNEYIQNESNINLELIKKIDFDPEKLYNKNIENLIGCIQIPVGVAGPIVINGQYAKGKFFVPLATTEGALVASISRGIKAINQAGGTKVIVSNKGVTRGPVFQLKSITQLNDFKIWFENNLNRIIEITKNSNSYIQFINYSFHNIGRNIWIRFSFDSDQAMGMNMATNATKLICDYILENYDNIKLIAISGNLCIDKKPSAINNILGRGKSVTVEVRLNKDIVNNILQTDIDSLVNTCNIKTWQGSMLAGSNVANAHIANIIAAIFAATGQDLAQVVESSSGFTIIEHDDDDVLVSVTMPSIMIGTIGGGTSLPHQKTLLELCLKNIDDDNQINNKTLGFAEIIASVVLAGELNLHAAIASNNLAQAHNKLGKGKYNETK